MSCCKILSGCGVPTTGCTGLVNNITPKDGELPFYIDLCNLDLYFWNGTDWVQIAYDAKTLAYNVDTRILTLNPDGSSVVLPLASATVAGLVKVSADSAVAVDAAGNITIDCVKLKAQCNLIDKSNIPAGNVIYYNTVTNLLDIDCTKLKQQCNLATLADLPVSGPVVTIDPTTHVLGLNCTALRDQCNLPVSGPAVVIDPTTHQLQVDCNALKAQCNLATVDQIPAVPTYNFGEGGSLSGTVLNVHNTQDPAAGVNINLAPLFANIDCPSVQAMYTRCPPPSSGGGGGGLQLDQIFYAGSSGSATYYVRNFSSVTKRILAGTGATFSGGTNAGDVTTDGVTLTQWDIPAGGELTIPRPSRPIVYFPFGVKTRIEDA